WLTPLIVFLIFVAVVTVAHDVVHGVLGLGRRQTDWALFLTGAVLLESGHAYRITHLQHHRLFPNEAEDPEGYPAHLGILPSILFGPIFLPKLWIWAFHRQHSRPSQRRWLLGEAAVPGIALVAGVLFWHGTPYVLAYAVMALIGSWVYPLLT